MIDDTNDMSVDIDINANPPEQDVSHVIASFSQQRIWLIHQMTEGGPQYNTQILARINGVIDIPSLEKSFNDLVERHEVLRTCFTERDGQPFQEIYSNLHVTLKFIDLTDLRHDAREPAADDIIAEMTVEKFDLSQIPLHRFCLIKTAEQTFYLVIVIHHVLLDGWSKAIIKKELSALYNANTQAQNHSLPELPIQYADFSLWQREWIETEVVEKQLAYWRQQLAGVKPVELSKDFKRPDLYNSPAEVVRKTIPPIQVRQLKSIAQAHGATTYMMMLTALFLIVKHYSQQEDLTVGSPIAGRMKPELEGLIGIFVNMLVMRIDLSDNPSLRQLLLKVRQICLDAYKNQYVPLEKLVEEIQPERALYQNPLFQIMMVYQSMPDTEFSFHGLDTEYLTPREVDAKFDLAIYLYDEDDGMRLVFRYNADLFTAATMEQLASHYVTLLESFTSQLDSPINTINVLSSEQYQQVMYDWNKKTVAYPQDKLVHELFERQVLMSPQVIALHASNETLTYLELNQRANQLARMLRENQIQPEDRVALCLDRDSMLIIAILAIWKAGAAYVPLDPAYPKRRLEFMIKNSQASVIIANDSHANLFASLATPVMTTDTMTPKLELYSNENLDCLSHNKSLAYVVYTSGSTGEPKGVMTEHKSVVALLYSCLNEFGKTGMNRMLASTTACFDASIREYFLPLISGGKIFIVENILSLAQQSIPVEVKQMQTVPSAVSELLSLDAIPDHIETLYLSGEPLKQSLVDEIYQKTHIKKIYDNYGVTECTGISISTQRIPGKENSQARPLANEKIYLLDSHRNQVPVGVCGEVYIGGDGVTRGYMGRADLTQQQFILHTFNEGHTERLYITGDIAKYLPDGTIKLFGRTDQQIKIRGFRIELGEIEAVLCRHPDVRVCAVKVISDHTLNDKIAAYYVPRSKSGMTKDSLRTYASESLPAYMIPTYLIPLDHLPMTPNGKIDRLALPAIVSNDVSDDEFLMNTTECDLARIWREVLNLEKVGLNDNFFELGGHSLLATRMIARIKNHYNTDLGLRAVFEMPTIAALARQLDSAQNSDLSFQKQSIKQRAEHGATSELMD